MNQPSDEMKEKMLLFFLRTSVPRILEERRQEEQKEKTSMDRR